MTVSGLRLEALMTLLDSLPLRRVTSGMFNILSECGVFIKN